MPQSGIYRIVNTATGDCYVGSSIHFERRKRWHFNALRRNGHHSTYMQRSFNVHGEGVFVWEIIEELVPDKKLLEERETYWIQTLQPAYNGSTVTSTRLGANLTPEQHTRLVERMNTPEMRRKISEGNKGKIVTEAARAKIREARAKQEITPAMHEALKQGQEIRKQVNPKPRLGMKSSEETRRKIAEKATGRTMSEETRQKQSERKRGIKQSEELIKKRSEGMKGHAVSEEARQKLSESNKAQWASMTEEERQARLENSLGSRGPLSEETRAKMRAAKLGKKRTPEAVEKSAAAHRGKIISEETRARMRVSNKAAAERRKAAGLLKTGPLSAEHKERISQANKARWARRKAAQQRNITQQSLFP